MGVTGCDGPNLACARCGLAVATRVDDCSFWQAVWLDPNAVRRLPAEEPAHRVADWTALPEGTPPIEQPGRWDPRWASAVGAALAHLLVAARGAPVAVPAGAASHTFGRALDALLPAGPAVRNVALAGPGLPEPAADIALVPPGPAARARDRGLPAGVLRDDPLPPHPWQPFRADSGPFLHTLARLPEVGQPWLRAIYDRCSPTRTGTPSRARVI